MTELEAVEQLRDNDTISIAEGAFDRIKELQSKCLAAEIPALATRPDASCSTGGCGVKLRLLIGSDDVQQVAALLDQEWRQLLAREGTIDDIAGSSSFAALANLGPDDEPPCPACGTAAPLLEGACSDCGLMLA